MPYHKRGAYIWLCCQCHSGPNNVETTPQCLERGCQHVRCSMCHLERTGYRSSEYSSSVPLVAYAPQPEEQPILAESSSASDQKTSFTEGLPGEKNRPTNLLNEEEQLVHLKHLTLTVDDENQQTPSLRVSKDSANTSSLAAAIAKDSLEVLDTNSDASLNIATPASSRQGMAAERSLGGDDHEVQMTGVRSDSSCSASSTPHSILSSADWVLVEHGLSQSGDDESLVEIFTTILAENFQSPEEGFTHVGTHDNNNPGSGAGSRSISSQTGEQNTRGQATKRKRNSREGDDGADQKLKKRRGPRRSDGPSKTDERLLACPFFKKDRERHGECRKFGGTKISYVKDHIYKSHYWHCAVCKLYFRTEEARSQHLRLQACRPNSTRQLDGITEGQRDWLGRKLPTGTKEEERWYLVWDKLFPELREQRPSNPWKEDITHPEIREMFHRELHRFPGLAATLENNQEFDHYLDVALRRLRLHLPSLAVFAESSRAGEVSTSRGSQEVQTEGQTQPGLGVPRYLELDAGDGSSNWYDTLPEPGLAHQSPAVFEITAGLASDTEDWLRGIGSSGREADEPGFNQEFFNDIDILLLPTQSGVDEASVGYQDTNAAEAGVDGYQDASFGQELGTQGGILAMTDQTHPDVFADLDANLPSLNHPFDMTDPSGIEQSIGEAADMDSRLNSLGWSWEDLDNTATFTMFLDEVD